MDDNERSLDAREILCRSVAMVGRVDENSHGPP